MCVAPRLYRRGGVPSVTPLAVVIPGSFYPRPVRPLAQPYRIPYVRLVCSVIGPRRTISKFIGYRGRAAFTAHGPRLAPIVARARPAALAAAHKCGQNSW